MLILAASTLRSQSESGSKSPFSVALIADGVEFNIGSQIVLQSAMTNTSDHDLVFTTWFLQSKTLGDKSVKVRQVVVELYDSEGSPVPLTLYGKAIRGQCGACGGKGVLDGLKPGESRNEVVDLSKEFDIKKPGKYSVQAQRLDEISKTLVKSSVVTINLVR